MLADAPDAWRWEATATHRVLVERDAAGARLLKESGPLARLRVTAPLGRIEWSAAFAHGRLDYDGRTQAGGLLATASRHTEAETGLRWRPLQPRAWGEAWVSLDALWFRRDIAATTAAAGLRETSVLWLAGVGWTGPAWQAAGWQLAPRAAWRTSIAHRLHIDYGGLFDPSSFRGGRRSDLSLGATAALASNWSLALDWRRSRQSASGVVAIHRSGAVAGTVFQPRLAIDDVALTLSRTF
ncbi:hypothetical protein [Ramlibacter sp. PS4R-6]|uniref:hypothetical protein n=1 Tax=Ramlibacter sp. PS4R-6 TaxID=3133438 RepID=UPI0030AC91A1